MLFEKKHYRFMDFALEEAKSAMKKGEIPVGAIIVKNNKIIGKGHNKTEGYKNATLHAEIVAINDALNFIGEKFLTNCDIYVTLEPCLMCIGALKIVRINNIFIAAQEPKFGACGSIYNVAEDDKYNHKPNVFFGIRELESKKLLESFFDEKRKSILSY